MPVPVNTQPLIYKRNRMPRETIKVQPIEGAPEEAADRNAEVADLNERRCQLLEPVQQQLR
jgi:hypothetical protein